MQSRKLRRITIRLLTISSFVAMMLSILQHVMTISINGDVREEPTSSIVTNVEASQDHGQLRTQSLYFDIYEAYLKKVAAGADIQSQNNADSKVHRIGGRRNIQHLLPRDNQRQLTERSYPFHQTKKGKASDESRVPGSPSIPHPIEAYQHQIVYNVHDPGASHTKQMKRENVKGSAANTSNPVDEESLSHIDYSPPGTRSPGQHH